MTAGHLKDPDNPSPPCQATQHSRTYHLGVQGNHHCRPGAAMRSTGRVRSRTALRDSRNGEARQAQPHRRAGSQGASARQATCALQAGTARQASHTTTPGVAVSGEWTPVRGKGGKKTTTAPIMPVRRPCKSVCDYAPTASVPHARPAGITHRPPTALRQVNTRRPLIARSLIALPGRTSPGSGTRRDQAPTATPGRDRIKGSAFAGPTLIARTATGSQRAGRRRGPGYSIADRSNRD
jgi:hypothetical protein